MKFLRQEDAEAVTFYYDDKTNCQTVIDIASIAKEAIKGGAKGVSAINTVLVLSGVDINTGNPLPDVWGKGGFGGYSGPAVRPIGLRMVGEIARERYQCFRDWRN